MRRFALFSGLRPELDIANLESQAARRSRVNRVPLGLFNLAVWLALRG